MNYTIVEQQTTNGVTAVVTPIEQKADFNEAVSVWHGKCAVAAISAVEHHAVTLLNERGQIVEYKCYDHEQPTEE